MSANKHYAVKFENNGRTFITTCVTIDGYSTEADIPKMIAIKYGSDAKILTVAELEPNARNPIGRAA